MSSAQYFVNVDIERSKRTEMSSQTSTTPSNLREVGTSQVLRHPNLRYVWYIRTAVGFFLVISLAMSAINSLLSITHVLLGIYLLIAFFPTFLLELGYLLRLVCGTDGALCQLFSGILHFDCWKRGVLYIFISIPLWIPAFTNNYGTACGVILIVTSILYIVKGWEYKTVRTFVSEEIGLPGGGQ